VANTETSVEDLNSTAAVGAQQSSPASGPAGGVPTSLPHSHTETTSHSEQCTCLACRDGRVTSLNPHGWADEPTDVLSDEDEVCATCKGRGFYTIHAPEGDADDQPCPECKPTGVAP
jgi:hypothetical protein